MGHYPEDCLVHLYFVREVTFSRYPVRETHDPGDRTPHMDIAKIGIAQDMEKRMSTMRANNGGIIREEDAITFPTRGLALRWEEKLHKLLSKNKTYGHGTEWFMAEPAARVWEANRAKMNADAIRRSEHFMTFRLQ